MKVKKEMTVSPGELEEGDELAEVGKLVYLSPIKYRFQHNAAVVDDGGYMDVVPFNDNEEVTIIREVRKPDIVRVGTNTGETMVIQDFDDDNVSISIFDRTDRAVYGAPFVSATELIDAIKTVKGLG